MKQDTHILIVDDDESIRRLLSVVLSREGYQTSTADDGNQAVSAFNEVAPDIVLMDIRMPGLSGIEAMQQMHAIRPSVTIILMTAFAELETAIQAIKLGVFDYVVKPFDLTEIKLLVERAWQMRDMRQQISVLREELSDSFRLDRILTNDPAMLALCAATERASKSNATVVILGESGVGKELLAASLHYNSPRARQPFVKLNCGAIPEGLLESELFGHEKGAFTGAVARRTGRFEQANGGTLFLDEIGELPLVLQVKLLRVLQDKEFERVGGEATLKTDVRIVAATHRDLAAMVEAGTFRRDLFYRLSVINLSVPPLRERRGDIPLLANHFLRKFAVEHGREIDAFDDHALALLQRQLWPGNVRELANAVERAVVMSSGKYIFAEDLPPHIIGHDQPCETPEGIGLGEEQNLKTLVRNFEAQVIVQVLERNNGNRSRTATELGISRRALLYKLHECRIESPDDCAE
jgi:two-component system response regulator AtoC